MAFKKNGKVTVYKSKNGKLIKKNAEDDKEYGVDDLVKDADKKAAKGRKIKPIKYVLKKINKEE